MFYSTLGKTSLVISDLSSLLQLSTQTLKSINLEYLSFIFFKKK